MVTASGFCTSPLTTYSRNACMSQDYPLGRCRRRGGFGCPLDKAGDRLAWLRAFAHPVLGPLQVQGEVICLLPRQVRAQLLDELAIARTAAISHNNTEGGLVLRPDSLQTNFNCHKLSCSSVAATSGPPRPTGLPQKEGGA